MLFTPSIHVPPIPLLLFVELGRCQVEFYAKNIELEPLPHPEAAGWLFSHDWMHLAPTKTAGAMNTQN